jgi:hypothetical protein
VVLLAANAVSYVVAGLLVLRLPAVPPERHDGARGGYRDVLADRAYLGLALLNVIMALHDSILIVAMPLWLATRTRAPLPLTGLLFALNTVLVVLLQVRTTRSVATPGRIGRGYRTAAASFVVACCACALAGGGPVAIAVVLLIVALTALISAELVTSAAEWFLSVNLAPARLRERYVGVFKTLMAVQQAAGPALVTTVLVGWGRLGWLALASLLAAGTLASGRLAARETGRRISPAPALGYAATGSASGASAMSADSPARTARPPASST